MGLTLHVLSLLSCECASEKLWRGWLRGLFHFLPADAKLTLGAIEHTTQAALHASVALLPLAFGALTESLGLLRHSLVKGQARVELTGVCVDVCCLLVVATGTLGETRARGGGGSGEEGVERERERSREREKVCVCVSKRRRSNECDRHVQSMARHGTVYAHEWA